MSLLFLFIVCFFQKLSGSVEQGAFSLTKGGRIRIGVCNFSESLFKSPLVAEWSCEDATTYTWRNDFDKVLGMLSATQLEKLAASAGFCPHRRCQLGNVSASSPFEECPPGTVKWDKPVHESRYIMIS